jgi:hypothetical protein
MVCGRNEDYDSGGFEISGDSKSISNSFNCKEKYKSIKAFPLGTFHFCE